MRVIGRRIVIWGSLLVLLAGGMTYSLWPRPVPVDITYVKTAPLTVAISEEGETRVRHVYTLHAPLRGYLQRLTVDPGDRVAANESELARIEPAPPEFLDVRTEAGQRAAVDAAVAARALAVAEVEAARVNLDYAKTELARARMQSEHQAISQRTLDEAERTFRVAETSLATAMASLEVRESELNQTRTQLLTRQEIKSRSNSCECISVMAPVDGLVLQVLRRSEGVVEAGTPLLEIGNPEDIEIVVDLLSEDAVTVNVGHRAVVRNWGGSSLEARVQRIEPLAETKLSALGIEEQRVTVVLDIASPPELWRSLGHGFRVDVDIIMFEKDVSQLPLGAFFRMGDEWRVFVVEDGRAALRKVVIGQRNALAVQVLEGIREGEAVVLYPSSEIELGTTVEARQISTQ